MEKREVQLTDDQIEQIATKAAEKAVSMMTNQLYQEVGKSVVNKFLWVVGVAAVALAAWAKGKGWL
jgi:hypothetical protein